MWTRLLVSASLVLALTVPAAAQQPTSAEASVGRTSLQIFRSVQRQVLTYPHFSVFDSINAQIKDGTIESRDIENRTHLHRRSPHGQAAL